MDAPGKHYAQRSRPDERDQYGATPLTRPARERHLGGKFRGRR